MNSNSFVKEVFKNSKLSKLTLKNRISSLSRLHLTKENYVSILSDIDKVDNKDKLINSRITFAFHIISLLREMEPTDVNKKLLSMYISKGDELKKIQLAKMKVNKGSKVGDLTLEQLQKELNAGEPDFEAFVSEPHPLDEFVKFYKDYEKHLLLSMYINMPSVRNDLCLLKIINKKSDLNDKENFILISNRAIYMYLTQYKTAERYGSIRIDVGDINARLIRNLIKLRKILKWSNPYLFTHTSKKGLSTINDDTTLIQRVRTGSNSYFGKILSINYFRHAWETHIQHSPEYINATIAEREAIHMKLLHSLGTALYYNKQEEE